MSGDTGCPWCAVKDDETFVACASAITMDLTEKDRTISIADCRDDALHLLFHVRSCPCTE